MGKMLLGFWEDEEEERQSRGSCCQDFGKMKMKNGEKQGKLLLPRRKSGSRNLVNFGEKKKAKLCRRGEEDRNFFGEEEEEIAEQARKWNEREEKQGRLFIYFLVFTQYSQHIMN